MSVRSLLALGSPVLILAAAPFLAGASTTNSALDVDPGDGKAAPAAVPVLVIPKGVKLSVEDLILMLPPQVQVEVLENGQVVLRAEDGSQQNFTVVVGETVLTLGGDSKLTLSLDGSASYDYTPSSVPSTPAPPRSPVWDTSNNDIDDPGDASPDRGGRSGS